MSRLLARRLAVGLAALLLAAPLAVESPADVLEDSAESDAFGSEDVLVRGSDPHARLLGLDDSSVRDSIDPTVSSLSLSRPPPEAVR